MLRTVILGTGSYSPSRVLTNSDLEKMVATSGPWIVSRTGIEERRVAAPEESTATMAAAAARNALALAGVDPLEIDMIILGTVTGDAMTPASAAYVQAAIGAANAFAFDVSAACAGSLYALSIADQFLQSGKIRRALVIGAETLSRVTDWTNRETCVLFGDGAGAMVLGRGEEEGRGLLATSLRTDGSLTGILGIPRPSAGAEGVLEGGKIKMKGREVYKFATRVLPEIVGEALAQAGVSPSEIDHVIAHQANARIIESVLANLGVPVEKCWMNIARFGNTSSASLPITLDEANRAGRLKKGDVIAMMAIGAGMTWGGAVMRW
ncbi:MULTISPECIES: beta-ketoacyl-ACP synthase III [Methylosinus]|uniref:Beta-ketoacyl-[acyl-carrier-protein] synthase III n=1 Tax=Methylosinus trichosporium (strain ATCC 35070 / NCIMB 11131 / UNIQEM 75 / OB3b) TaxID=595536 RepID=A0A2D2D2H2_METT3|nr:MULTISPECIES: beta-ketoacyl-ACP synthase III [Methylosinus]ATQ69166.1 ketoacyl-ACP synthase III [Methylosinus trichosporium OB3b]OBS53590.1 3-oxoacyl-ACP synthase [Methylosinus sp. 3S-1]